MKVRLAKVALGLQWVVVPIFCIRVSNPLSRHTGRCAHRLQRPQGRHGAWKRGCRGGGRDPAADFGAVPITVSLVELCSIPPGWVGESPPLGSLEDGDIKGGVVRSHEVYTEQDGREFWP